MRSPSPVPIDPEETARLTVRAGWPRDLLSWVMALPSLLYLGAIAAGFAGFSVFVIVVLISSRPLVASVLGGITMLGAWYAWAREHFGVSKQCVRFFADRIVADLRVTAAGRGGFSRRPIPYDAIGTICLAADRAAIQIRFDLPQPSARSALTISLPRLTVRDQFDEIQRWIEAGAPRHLFVARGEDGPQYSRAFTVEEVFPWQALAQGNAVIDSLHTHGHIEMADRTFPVSMDGYGFSPIRILASTDAPDAILASVFDQHHTDPTVRVLARQGFEIAACVLVPDGGNIRIAFGWGTEITLNLTDGVIKADGVIAGSLHERGEGAVLHISRPLAIPVVLSIFLVLHCVPYLIPQRRGSAFAIQ